MSIQSRRQCPSSYHFHPAQFHGASLGATQRKKLIFVPSIYVYDPFLGEFLTEIMGALPLKSNCPDTMPKTMRKTMRKTMHAKTLNERREETEEMSRSRPKLVLFDLLVPLQLEGLGGTKIILAELILTADVVSGFRICVEFY